MRAIIQRVNGAELSVDGKLVSKIEHGLLVLLGVKNDDTEADALYIAEKLPKLRIFRDDEDKMNLSVLDVGGEILLVSNFTLYAETRGTNRPSFSRAGGAEMSQPLYELVAKKLKEKVPTKLGMFGEHMHINSQLDGPVTIVMDSEILKNVII